VSLWLSSMRAVAGVTVKEAVRQRLWLLFAAAALVLMAAGLRLGAVDPAARLKLAVVAINVAIGFVVVLLAILVGSGQLRRDLDGRHSFLLFSKPLGAGSYLAGRWSGLMAVLLAGIVSLSALGTALVWWHFDRLPPMLEVATPQDWQELSALGEAVPVDAGRERLTLAGAPGNGVRWVLGGLPTDLPPEGLTVLLQVQVRGADAGVMLSECAATVSAAPGSGARLGERRLLALAPSSPFGRGTGEAALGAGQVMLRHKEAGRGDYSQDWMHLLLPADRISLDGTCTIELVRLDARAAVVAGKSRSLQVARDGGSLFANLVRGGGVLLAIAGLLAAFTLLLSIAAKLGVVLLGGLTLFFAGSAVWTIQDTLTYEKLSLPTRRMLEGALVVMPDFDRFTVSARLAAGQAVPWSTVWSAWSYYGIFTAVFLGCAWLALRRKEL
jgi:hypothetical protein